MTEQKTKNIGFGIPTPKEICVGDKNCPFHGELSLRGRSFTGTVVSAKAHKIVTVEWTGQKLNPKYERYEKTRTRVKAHNPECINAKEGDVVKIMESRPISKTKNFVVVQKLGDQNVSN